MNIQLFFKDFIKKLKIYGDKIAYLQLGGKLEDYLVKEFCYALFEKSNGELFSVTNLGNKGEQRIDICVVKGEDLDDPTNLRIIELIEAKYFTNTHEWRTNLTDEDISKAMNRLNKQMNYIEKDKIRHGWLQLNSDVDRIDGLVFASYVGSEENEIKKEKYFERVLQKAKETLNNIDSEHLILEPIFDDIRIMLANKTRYVSLRAGLWMLN